MKTLETTTSPTYELSVGLRLTDYWVNNWRKGHFVRCRGLLQVWAFSAWFADWMLSRSDPKHSSLLRLIFFLYYCLFCLFLLPNRSAHLLQANRFLGEKLYFLQPEAPSLVVLYHSVDVPIFFGTAGIILRVIFPGIHHPLSVASLRGDWVQGSRALQIVDKAQKFEFVLWALLGFFFAICYPHDKF